jgi:hypothetical protein
MSIVSNLRDLLAPVVSERAYFNNAPDSPAPPYITFFRVSGIEGLTLDTNGGTDNETETRFQIDVWALGGVEVIDKAEAVKAALKGWGVSNTVLLERDDYEPDTKLHRVQIDVQTIK